MSFRALNHVIRPLSYPLPHKGMILVLDTGAQITPEAEAMLQALYSRSIEEVLVHLDEIQKKGPEKFMSTFYVGYGHKSIGDCGTGTIFIEGVSMLAAKAIQDWALYSGQEASTRYIDFSKQYFLNPIGSQKANALLEDWRVFYLHAQKPLQTFLCERFPRAPEEKESVYDKAIKARAFDILRGFLPAGATTKLAWHTNLRQAADKLALLRHHPLEEVRMIADAIEDALKEMFPSSFGHKRYQETEDYNAFWMGEKYYFTNPRPSDYKVTNCGINRRLVAQYQDILERRPPKTELPKFLAECGTMQLEFTLDFASFRDIQRHRAVIQRMPLVCHDHGFEPWYLNELPSRLRTEAEQLLLSQENGLRTMILPQSSKEEAQYYTAMGYRLPNRLTGDLPALVYLAELRATRFVHSTLRKRAIQIGETLEQLFGKHGLKIHFDKDPDRFDVKRGEHDIVKV